MKKQAKKKNVLAQIITSPLVLNLGIMVLVGIILLMITLYGLDRYTKHNESVTVPDIKKIQVEEAIKILENSNLKGEISDSVYLDSGIPGSVIEQVPIATSQVKRDRTVFLITQAKSVQLIAMPELRDISQRQALAILNALEFKDVSIRTVPSQYAGLVMYATHRGDSVGVGQKLPKGSPIQLVVGGGGVTVVDSLDWDEDEDEDENVLDKSLFN